MENSSGIFLKMKATGKYHCNYFWNHVAIDSRGAIRPCCRYLDQVPAGQLNDGLAPVFSNAKFQQLRSNSMDGLQIPGCQTCYDADAAELPSLRTYANSKTTMPPHGNITGHSGDIEDIHLSIGNLCNLKCTMCSPKYSHLWEADYKKLGWSTKSFTNPHKEKIDFPALFTSLPKLKRLRIVGGEPLLSLHHDNLLTSLQEKYKHSIALDYFTNLTKMPCENTLKAWQNIGNVALNLSIDAHGALNDYIRYPSKWKTIASNLEGFIALAKRHSFIKIQVHTTVSILNIVHLANLRHHLASIFRKHRLPLIHKEVLIHQPTFLSVKHMPQRLKRMVILNESNPAIVQFAKQHLDAEPQWEPLVSYLESIDKLRTLKSFEVLPHLFNSSDIGTQEK